MISSAVDQHEDYSLSSNLNNKDNNNNNFHHVQVIDEDIENFKRRLDILTKNFKTDTLKDFMAIKRNLLTEQRSIIESEKKKCDATVCSKVDEIEHLKENLAKIKHQLLKQTEINEKLSLYLFKIKQSDMKNRIKKKSFGMLKAYYFLKRNSKRVFSSSLKPPKI